MFADEIRDDRENSNISAGSKHWNVQHGCLISDISVRVTWGLLLISHFPPYFLSCLLFLPSSSPSWTAYGHFLSTLAVFTGKHSPGLNAADKTHTSACPTYQDCTICSFGWNSPLMLWFSATNLYQLSDLWVKFTSSRSCTITKFSQESSPSVWQLMHTSITPRSSEPWIVHHLSHFDRSYSY